MKKITCLLLLATLCFVNDVNAQEGNKSYRSAVKLNIAALADDISFPTIRLALERAVSKRIALSGELGYQLYSIDGYLADPEFVKESGIKANIELRRYARRSRSGNIYPPLAGFYTGLNFLYAQNRRNLTAHYYKNDDHLELTDRFYARKTITGLSFVLGYQLAIRYPASLKPGITKPSRHILFDFYGSLGPAYRNNKNYNRNYHTASDSLLRSRHVNLSDATVKSYLEENSRVIIRPALGIRLGYRL